MYKLLFFAALVVLCNARSVEDEIADLKRIMVSQEKQIALQGELIAQIREEKASSLATVAFMTTIAEFSTNYTDNDVIVFNDILQDTASGAFDPSTGMYTIPVDGLYLFYMKVGAFINGDWPADEDPIGNPYNAEIIIQVDGTDIANSNCFDGWDYIRNCQMTYPLQLVTGQVVSVKIKSTQPGDEGYLTVQGIQETNFKTISWFGGHLVL